MIIMTVLLPQGTALQTGKCSPSSFRFHQRGRDQIRPVVVEPFDHDEHTDMEVRSAGYLRRVVNCRDVQRRSKVIQILIIYTESAHSELEYNFRRTLFLYS